jgi:hypothetical protein
MQPETIYVSNNNNWPSQVSSLCLGLKKKYQTVKISIMLNANKNVLFYGNVVYIYFVQ